MEKNILKNEQTDALFEALLQIKDIDQCYAFFEDLCTINELKSMTQRFEVARLLHEGMTFSAISDRTGASTATITRVNKCLQYGSGYSSVLGEKDSQ